jgi:hypothetical protein
MRRPENPGGAFLFQLRQHLIDEPRILPLLIP